MIQKYTSIDPGTKVKDFVEGFNDAIVKSEEDLEIVVDRFHSPDMIQIADTHTMDRTKLLAHVRSVRRTKPEIRVEILDAMSQDDRVAARYLMHVNRSRGNGPEPLVIEVWEFVEFAADGRLRRADALTRTREAPTGPEGVPRLPRSEGPPETVARTYRIAGMTCDHCEQTVSGEISRLDDVDSVHANADAGIVIVSSQKQIDEARLRGAVERAGYEFAGVE